VKLFQFDPADSQHKIVDTRSADFLAGGAPGRSVLSLHEFVTERVALVHWAPGTRFNRHRHWGGEEILALEGMFQDEYGNYPAGSWLRSPHGSEHAPFSDDGCLIYVKFGHLSGSVRAGIVS